MVFRGHRRQLLRALRPLRSFISALQPSTSGLSCHTRGTEVQYPPSSLSHVTLHLHAVSSSMSISSGSSNPVSSLDQYCRQHMAIFFNSHRLIQPVIRSLAGTQNASRGWPGSGFLKLTSTHIDDQGCLMLQGEVTECKAYNTAFGTTKNLEDTTARLVCRVFTHPLEFPEYAVSMEAANPQCWGFGMFDRQKYETVQSLSDVNQLKKTCA